MKKPIFIILLVGLFFHIVVAQEAKPNAELIALINQAFNYYPKVRELELASQSAATAVELTRGQYLPTVSADASFNYLDPIAEASFGAPGQEQKFQFQPNDNYNFQIGTKGLILDFGKTKTQVDKALAQAQQSKDNLEAFRTTIAYQVAQIFYGIVFTNQAIAVQQSQIAALEDNSRLVATKVKAGEALQLDLLNANVALENTRNRLTDLQAQLEKQRAYLKMFTGNDGTGITTQGFDFQTIPVEMESLLQAAKTSNSDILLANDKIQYAEKEILYNRKFLLPTLTYNGALGVRNGYQPDINQWRFNYVVGLGLSYPLYVGGRDRKQLHISELSLDAAKASLDGALQNLESDISQALADIHANQLKLDKATTVIEQAQSAMQITQSRFKNGVATNNDVLTAQANLEQAQLSEIQYRYQLCLSNLTLDKLQGVHFW